MKEAVIIGGGIIGMWCAWHLQEAGVQVSIVDKGEFSDGCSYGNAGMVVPSHFVPLASPGMMAKGIKWMFSKDSPFYIRPRMNLELAQWLWLFYRSSTKKHVAESASLLKDMHTESRELYRQLQSSGFDFKFEQKGILMLFRTAEAEQDELEMATAAHQLGIQANFLTHEQLAIMQPRIRMDVKGAVYYPGDCHFTPHLLMNQMKAHLQTAGVEFLEKHEVANIEDQGKNGCTLSCKNGNSIQAKQVIIANGSWSGKLMRKSGYRLPMQDGKGYSMTIPNLSHQPSIPALLHEARVAVTPMGDQLRVSGTLEISGMDDQVKKHKVNSIVKAVSAYYPDIKLNDMEKVWFGYRPCTPDGMPYIGRWKENSAIIVATGHAMMGLSLAPSTGRMVRDIFLEKSDSSTSNKLDPHRFQSK